MERNIKNVEGLLQNIAAGLNQFNKPGCRTPVNCIEVTFHCEMCKYSFALPQALNYLANDIYWDETGNWADATHATVDTI
jgi:hypothetical protein